MPKKGYKQTEEHKRHQRESQTGKKRPPITDEHRRKLSDAGKGKKRAPFTEEHLRHMSESNKGIPKPPRTEEHKRNISEAKKGENNPFFGKTFSDEHRRKLSGSNSSNWKGGISFEPYCILFTKEFKERVREYFGYQCVECGEKQNGRKLDVHHVNFNKDTCCDDSTPIFVPLCRSCHSKTNFNRDYWQTHFTDMIDQHYGGKCYLSKEEIPLLMQQLIIIGKLNGVERMTKISRHEKEINIIKSELEEAGLSKQVISIGTSLGGQIVLIMDDILAGSDVIVMSDIVERIGGYWYIKGMDKHIEIHFHR